MSKYLWPVSGCTHFIIGRDMAGSKSSLTGEDFYGAYDAQDMANKHAEELNMQTVPSLNITYTEVPLPSCLFHPTPPPPLPSGLLIALFPLKRN